MPAEIVTIAEAVKEAINAATFSQEVVAERLYVPVYNLQDMGEIKCSVVPSSLGSEQADRSRNVFTYVVEVAVQQKIEPTVENLDALMALVEEIAAVFRSKRLAEYDAARCMAVENDPAYAPEHIEEFGQFTSVLSLTFRVWR